MQYYTDSNGDRGGFSFRTHREIWEIGEFLLSTHSEIQDQLPVAAVDQIDHPAAQDTLDLSRRNVPADGDDGHVATHLLTDVEGLRHSGELYR